LSKEGRPCSFHMQPDMKKLGIRVIGKTGRWVLKEWDMNTNSVAELIEQTLTSFKTPLKRSQIIEELNTIREIEPNTIRTVLCSNNKFVQYTDKQFGLKKWALNRPIIKRAKRPHSSIIWDQIIEHIIKILKKNKGRMIFSELIKEIALLGYIKPTIYAAVARKPDLFKKGENKGRSSGYISLVR
jgi:hypothetical protein